MGFLDVLSSLLPDIEIGDIIIGGEKTVEETEQRTVIIDSRQADGIDSHSDATVVDIAELTDEQRELAQEALLEEWESVEELFKQSTARDKAAIKTGFGDTAIRETLDYFRPILPEHYFGTLEAALHMHKQMSMMDPAPSEWVRKRRKDIAEKYDGETYQVINLCSAGYFDEGRYLRELYEEMYATDEYREGDFAEVFEQIVEHSPFTIFVSGGDHTSDVKQRIYSKIRNRERHDVRVEFIDVRGIGSDNRAKIDEALKRIVSEVGDFEAVVKNEEPERVVRIDPDTLSPPD